MDKNATATAARTNFLADIKGELKKVTWPTKQETIKLTATVFIISLIVALYVGIIDVVLAKILEIVTKTR